MAPFEIAAPALAAAVLRGAGAVFEGAVGVVLDAGLELEGVVELSIQDGGAMAVSFWLCVGLLLHSVNCRRS